MHLLFRVEKFSKYLDNNAFSFFLDNAKVQNVYTTRENIKFFYDVIFGKSNNYYGDIFLQNINIRREKIALSYLQKFTLFITDKIPIFLDWTVEENMSFYSDLWCKENLSAAGLLAMNLIDKKDTLGKDLTLEEKQLLNLSRLIVCPTHLWFLEYNLIANLSDENKKIIDNAIDIRIKNQGAVVMLHEDND